MARLASSLLPPQPQRGLQMQARRALRSSRSSAEEMLLLQDRALPPHRRQASSRPHAISVALWCLAEGITSSSPGGATNQLLLMWPRRCWARRPAAGQD